MTKAIDTPPAALRELAEPHTYLNACGDRVNVCETKTGHVICGFDMSELLAIAAEKEAAGCSSFCAPGEPCIVSEDGKCLAEKEARQPEPSMSMFASRADYDAAVKAQHHPEQHLEMVAPADVPLPKVPFAWYWPSGCGKWVEVFVHAVAVKLMLPCGKPLYTADQLHQYAEAYAKAAVAAVYEQCVRIIEGYQVPVGNSAAGEMAAEWTMDALREVREAIRAAQKGTT